MDILITHAVVVTGDDARTIHADAAVAVTGNRIAAVGATADLERDYPRHERFDARGLAVFPGFINA
ncbi:MAG: amidohydrolase, partial [Phreatobacter sp.]|nr:amidohydrolase [Phreatobacter sp.]